MHADIQLAMFGVAAGALLVLLASGLVVIYRSSGILNFAHGAQATLAAYTYLHLHNHAGVPLGAAMVLGVAAAVAVGGVFQFVIIRRLRDSHPVAKVVATLGLLVAVTASIQPVFGSRDPQPVPLLAGETITLPFGEPAFVLPHDRAWIIAIAVVGMGALWALFRYSAFGRATRAASDNERATAMLGVSPQRLELLNWLLGSALAGISGILLSSIAPPTITSYNVLTVAAISIAIVGAFRSFSVVLVFGLLFGAVQAVLLRYTTDLQEATTFGGWAEALPLVVIILAVTLRGKSIPVKDTIERRRLPKAPNPRLSAGTLTAVTAAGVAIFLVAPRAMVPSLTTTVIGAVMAMSLVVLVGYAGQISLAQVSLAGFGAFVTARLATDAGLPFPLPLLLGALAVVPLGVLLAVPALRVRGLHLAVVTLAFAVVMDVMFFPNVSLTGGNEGLTVTPAALGPLDLDGLTHPRAYGVFVLLLAVAVAVGVVHLRRSRLGVRMLALRDNERGAAASGMSVMTTKVLAFGLAAAIAGLAGGLQGYSALQLSWAAFSYQVSIVLLAFTCMGGVTRVSGAAVAGLLVAGGIVSYVLHIGTTVDQIIAIVGGVGTMLIVVDYPDGLAALGPALRRRFARGGRQGGQPGSRGAAPGREPDEPPGRSLDRQDRIEVPR